MKNIACKKCSWKDKCEGNKQQCRVDVFIDDFCKKCDFWNTESLICMFGELDCDDPDRRKCREFLGLKGDKMIKKLAELAKEENVVFNYCIGPDNAMSITVFAKCRDFIIINPSSFSDDEIIEITKDVIRRAKE